MYITITIYIIILKIQGGWYRGREGGEGEERRHGGRSGHSPTHVLDRPLSAVLAYLLFPLRVLACADSPPAVFACCSLLSCLASPLPMALFSPVHRSGFSPAHILHPLFLRAALSHLTLPYFDFSRGFSRTPEGSANQSLVVALGDRRVGGGMRGHGNV